MLLYLVRHGKAKTKEEDPERALSDKGRGDVEKVAAFLKPKLSGLKVIWQSGKKRAEETARIIASAVGHEVEIIEKEGLAPLDPVSSVVETIVKRDEDLMLVGHMPFLGELAATLLTGATTDRTVEFRAAGAICLRRSENGNCNIEWTANPNNVT